MYFEVCAKCGHVGRKFYVEKVFAVCARSAREAARFARQIPRVKHDHKDAIKYVREIDEERFDEIMLENEEDMYFKCKNIQEQRLYCNLDLIGEPGWEREEQESNESVKAVYCGKERIRNPKKFVRNYSDDEWFAA